METCDLDRLQCRMESNANWRIAEAFYDDCDGIAIDRYLIVMRVPGGNPLDECCTETPDWCNTPLMPVDFEALSLELRCCGSDFPEATYSLIHYQKTSTGWKSRGYETGFLIWLSEFGVYLPVLESGCQSSMAESGFELTRDLMFSLPDNDGIPFLYGRCCPNGEVYNSETGQCEPDPNQGGGVPRNQFPVDMPPGYPEYVVRLMSRDAPITAVQYLYNAECFQYDTQDVSSQYIGRNWANATGYMPDYADPFPFQTEIRSTYLSGGPFECGTVTDGYFFEIRWRQVYYTGQTGPWSNWVPYGDFGSYGSDYVQMSYASSVRWEYEIWLNGNLQQVIPIGSTPSYPSVTYDVPPGDCQACFSPTVSYSVNVPADLVFRRAGEVVATVPLDFSMTVANLALPTVCFGYDPALAPLIESVSATVAEQAMTIVADLAYNAAVSILLPGLAPMAANFTDVSVSIDPTYRCPE